MFDINYEDLIHGRVLSETEGVVILKDDVVIRASWTQLTVEEFDATDYPIIEVPTEPEVPTEQDLINAELILNQAQTTDKLNAMDEVLATILLETIGRTV
jgi:hypothetical protein